MNRFDKHQFWSTATPIDENILIHVKSCLVMVPHPDDESLGCAGLIANLVSHGAQVNLILTTDGSGSHPNSKKFRPDQLAAVRLSELREAMRLMGLCKESLRFYGARDAHMPTRGEAGFSDLVGRLTSDLIRIQPDLILVPYELDPHRDHRATHQLLLSALEQAGIARPRIWEYPIWLYEIAAESDIPALVPGELLLLDIEPHLPLKAQCINAHRSQVIRMIDDDPSGFILLPEVISNFTQRNEYFMERKKINPNGTLEKGYFEEMYQGDPDPWNFQTSEYEREKYQSTIAAIPTGPYQRALEIGCSIGVLTQMLSEKCGHLLAMDISETALELARKRMAGSDQVEFLLGAVPDTFPKGGFDLIVVSEVGYYLSMEDLLTMRGQILHALIPNGVLILVHWTHFVADYPLSGDEVHDCFNALGMPHLEVRRKKDYRLDVYRKP